MAGVATAAGVPEKARGEARAATCYATIGANRVRAVYDQALAFIEKNRDPVRAIVREYDKAAAKDEVVGFLARIHGILDAVAARTGGTASGNQLNINNLFLGALKQAGEGAKVIDGVQSGAEPEQATDNEW